MYYYYEYTVLFMNEIQKLFEQFVQKLQVPYLEDNSFLFTSFNTNQVYWSFPNDKTRLIPQNKNSAIMYFLI